MNLLSLESFCDQTTVSQASDLRFVEYTLHVLPADRIDDLDIRVKQFFMNCRKAKPEWKEQQYKQIRDVSMWQVQQ